MSFDAMSWAAKQPCKNSLSKLTLLMLANYADEHHKTYPSYATLARLCVCNERTVMRAIRSLEDEGLVSIQKRFTSDGKQTSNIFILNVGGDKSDRVGVTNSTLNTIRDTQNNKNKRGDKYDKDFLEWWNVYPRNDGSKSKAFENWKRATDKFIGVRELFLATCRFKQTQIGKDKKFVPMATTWLNQRRWETIGALEEVKTTKNNLAG